MKPTKTFLAAVLVSAALFSSVCSFASTAPATAILLNSETITSRTIEEYLIGNRRNVLTTPVTADGGRTWTCLTEYEGGKYETKVYTDGVNIIGWDDSGVE